jgi:hypothetical protein
MKKLASFEKVYFYHAVLNSVFMVMNYQVLATFKFNFHKLVSADMHFLALDIEIEMLFFRIIRD